MAAIQDGGRRHLQKSKNRHIFSTVSPIATKLGDLTQFDPLTVKILKFRNPKMSAAATLKNRKSPYFGNGLTDRRKFGKVTQLDPYDRPDR